MNRTSAHDDSLPATENRQPLIVPDVSGLSAIKAAHRYLEAGIMPHPWKPVPGRDGSKTKGSAFSGFTFADAQVVLQTHESIDRWEPRWRVGIATCALTGLIAIDVDDPQAFEAWEFSEFPETAASTTGRDGGVHLLLDARDLSLEHWPTQGNIPGGQIKSNGFISAAPSLHVDGRRRYGWTSANSRVLAPIGSLGRKLAEYRAAANGSASGDRATAHKMIASTAATAPPDQQHDSLRDYAWDLAATPLGEDEIMLLMRSRASGLQLSKGAWTDADLLDLVRSARSKRTPDAWASELSGPDDFQAIRTGTDTTPGHNLAVIPQYPADAMAGPIGKMISSCYNMDPAMIGGACLAAISTLCGNARIAMPDGTEQSAALWIPLIGARGCGKTPAIDKYAFARMRELDHEAWTQFRSDLMDYHSMTKDEKQGISRPKDTTVLHGDITMEKLAATLSECGGISHIAVDELSGYLRGIGQYKPGRGADLSKFLELWAGSPWRYERVNEGKDYYIMNPVVSVVGGIQPSLHALLGNDESGQRDRWLPHMATRDAEYPDKPINLKFWDALVTKMYGMRGEMRVWPLEGEAIAAWREAAGRWSAMAKADDTSELIRGALRKADVQCARASLVIAESMHPGGGKIDSDMTIPIEAMLAAIAITDYCIQCWRALGPVSLAQFAKTPHDARLAEKIPRLIEWLDARKDKQATKSDMVKLNVVGITTAAEAEALLRAYEKAYPGCVQWNAKTGKRGPRPTVVKAPERSG